MRRTEALKAITRVLKRPVENVPAADLIYGRALSHVEDPQQAAKPWAMQVDVLALKIAGALPLTDDAEEASPLAQAEEAKRRRDLVGELSVLQSAGQALESAPWYPCRPGDMVHVHYEAVGDVPLIPAFGETYAIGDAGHGLLSMRLLAHTLPEGTKHAEGMVGCFAAEAADCPVYELWFEGGPHRLTIVRDGRVVHGRPAHGESEAAAAGTKLAAMTMAAAIREAEQYLERGEPELALARLRSDVSLAPCGTPGPMADMADCARPSGHRPPCSPDADYTTPPHACPALPEQLHAVVTVGAKVEDVHIAGLYEDRQAAVDHCTGFATFREDLIDRHVRPAPGLPDEMVLTLPAENQYAAIGVQLAVAMPVRVMPDPFAEDAWAEEGKATCLGPEDYADDYDHEDA